MKYYALTNPVELGSLAEQNGTRLALFDLGDNELGQVIGMTVYTTPDGEPQRRDLKRYEGLIVEEVSPEELLEAYGIGMPSSVTIDGWRLPGPAFVGLIKAAMGLPIKHPQEYRLRASRMPQDAQIEGG